jgi:2-C-methyl-D-erythritol 2,4-cyclodiphosphate synthase
MMNREGYEVENIDSVIVCEKPRIAPHVQAIKDSLSQIMGLPGDRIGIKATTTDRMGFTGRGEGIASYAVALIKKVTLSD